MTESLSRLEAQEPEIANAMKAASLDSCLNVAFSICSQTLQVFANDEVDAAALIDAIGRGDTISAALLTRVSTTAEQLDENYWATRSKFEAAETAESDEYLRAFCRFLAVNAVVLLATDHSSRLGIGEAIYEALAPYEDNENQKRRILELLQAYP